MNPTESKNLVGLAQVIETIRQLRAPGGCPWDREQTHQSLRQYLIEEAYEVLDVLDQIESPNDLKKIEIRDSFKEELGDLLMQVLLHSEMANETAAFNIDDVAKFLNDKLIRRHPHVFGELKETSSESAVQRWEKEKAKEKANQPKASILDGVPRGLPTLQRASRVLEKVTGVGFQWKDMTGPLEKVDEELEELKVEILQYEKIKKEAGTPELLESARQKVEGELGDLIFTLCNIGYLLKANPETSLRGTMSRFENRFRYLERKLKEAGKLPEDSQLSEMDRLWDEAKHLENVKVWGLTGGIASGKTTVGSYFSELGIPVIDADLISRELMKEQGAAYSSVLKRFGTVDRSQIRKIVFEDPNAKKDLEAILHPLIREESRSQIEVLGLTHPVIIYEAALLVEAGRLKEMTGLIVVESKEEYRISRLESRSQISQKEVRQIIDSQTSDDERRKFATFVLQNNGTLEQLKSQVVKLVEDNNWNAKTF